MKVHYAGNLVYVERYMKNCLHFYHGKISANKRLVSGKYLIGCLVAEGAWIGELNY